MNFQELMSKASANNIVSKQLTKSGQKHKDSGSGVSTSAVKAFLERKEQERKKKQADEEAARRARIQARLQQNLQPNQVKKGKSTPKSSFLNQPYAKGEAEEEEEERSIQGKQKHVPLQHQKSVVLSKPSVSGIKSKEINKNATTSNRKSKNSERISKEKPLKSNNFVTNEKRHDTSKVKKKSKTGPAQPNFKELLAIAEQNKSGLKRKPEALPAGKSQVGVKASKAKRQSFGDHKLTEIDEKDIPIKNKGKFKQTDSQRKPAVEPDKIGEKYRPCNIERTQAVKRTRDLNSTRVQNGLDKKASRPRYARPQEQKTFYARPASGYYYDEDEEEDSDLDGFIDDGEDEACGGQTDVSKYIKDIFGYDRRRYAMEDIDDCAMESNFGQIEREEKRSAKIAKLEDEIEILKEQAELKRQRDKLKSKKPKK